MARSFAGADYAQFGIGGLVGIGSSAHSLWAICRRGANGAWHTPISIETSGGSSKLALQFSDTNTIQLIIGTSNKDTTVGITSSDGWVLAGVSRASGSSVPRGHKYVYSSNVWTHTDAGAATGGDSTDLTGGRVQIGEWQNTDRFNGEILEVGAVKRALTDAEWEQLPFTLLAAVGMVPDGLWLLDQHATSQAIGDLTGNGANQTALTSTSIGTTSVPVWSYGAGAVTVVGQSGGAATHDIAAAVTATATITAAATADKPIAAALTVTASRTADASSTKPVAATLTATATLTAAAASTKPVAAAVAATAAITAGAGLDKPVAASLTVTAAVTAAADTAGAPPVEIAAAVTAVATITPTAAATRPAAAALTVTAAVTASMSTVGTGLAGDIHGPQSQLPGAVAHQAISLAGTIGD
jgi:hypothetical protein